MFSPACIASCIVLCLLWATCSGRSFNDDAPELAKKSGELAPGCIKHHSFHPPLVAHVFTIGLPFWEFGGDAVLTDAYLRLTPDSPSRSGYAWNLEPLRLNAWELTIGFHVHSKSAIGADGFALWFVDKVSRNGGPLFGHPAKFRGVGVLFDTFDNDGQRDNPSLNVVSNDGEQDFEYHKHNDFKSASLASCRLDYHNPQVHRVPAVRLKYEERTLSIYVDWGLRDGSEELCAVANNIDIPSGYYIGLTAETGGFTDTHDIYFVNTRPVGGVEYDHDIYLPKAFDHGSDRQEKDFWRQRSPEEVAAQQARLAEEEARTAQLEAERQEILRKLEEEQLQHQHQQQQQQQQAASQGQPQQPYQAPPQGQPQQPYQAPPQGQPQQPYQAPPQGQPQQPYQAPPQGQQQQPYQAPPQGQPQQPYQAPPQGQPQQPYQAPPQGQPQQPYQAPPQGQPQQPYQAPPQGQPQQPYQAPPQGQPQQPYQAPPQGQPQQPYQAPPQGQPQQPYQAPPQGQPQQPYQAPPQGQQQQPYQAPPQGQPQQNFRQ